jgi:hypothetical protein
MSFPIYACSSYQLNVAILIMKVIFVAVIKSVKGLGINASIKHTDLNYENKVEGDAKFLEDGCISGLCNCFIVGCM